MHKLRFIKEGSQHEDDVYSYSYIISSIDRCEVIENYFSLSLLQVEIQINGKREILQNYMFC